MTAIDGILLLDKPKGLSSNACLQRVRRSLDATKAGHSGTLDPMATGLLPIGLGQGTKSLSYLLDAHKRYVATLKLGITTTTGDAEGEVLAVKSIPALSVDKIQTILSGFVGPCLQIPPMYSALKQQGKPLYELARAGITVERKARAIVFHSIDFLAWNDDELVIQVWCSKGTYIRTLAEDVGDRLGCGAHLTALRRIGVAGLDPISEGDASRFVWCDWEQVLTKACASYLLPIDSVLRHFPKVELDKAILKRLSQGQKISAQDLPVSIDYHEQQILRVYDLDDVFYGLVRPTPYQGIMLERWMASEASMMML